MIANSIKEQMEHNWVGYFKLMLKGDETKNWQEWHENYHELQDSSIENLFDAIQYCQTKNRYEDLKEIWKYLSDYAHIYGYWNQRSNWLEWLGVEAQKRGDWEVFVSIIAKKAWTKILIGSKESLSDAEALLRQALKHCLCGEENTSQDCFREAGVSLEVQYDVAENQAALFIRQGKYEEAQKQLERAKALVDSCCEVHKHELSRRLITINYYKGEIEFRKKNYQASKILFESVIRDSTKCHWYRASNYAYNWVADIAINQGELDKAQFVIETNQKVAEDKKDLRRVACFQASDARLAGARENYSAATQKAKAALSTFEKLGMTVEISEMQHLIKCFKNQASK